MPRRLFSLLALVAILSTLSACGQEKAEMTRLVETVVVTATPQEVLASVPAAEVPPTTPPTTTAVATAPEPSATPTKSPPPTADSMLPPAQAVLGSTWTRPADGMTMVYAPGGDLQMGSAQDDPQVLPDELPLHTVRLDSFWIDRNEVTNAQFVQFLNEQGSGGLRGSRMIVLDQGYTQVSRVGDRFATKETARDRPVVMVTWHGAAAYCEWAGGRLPTEAEWEYAARGPEGNLYPWGSTPPDCDLANHGTCVGVPVNVGSRPAGASWCGAMDMAGNVWEWVADQFGPYSGPAQNNPTGPDSGDVPVLRGGGWHSPPWELRAAYRQHDLPANGYNG
jgi:serine/threonine-protein kinase